jgi:hypothetical protein
LAFTLGGGGVFVAQAASSAPSSVVTIDPVRILDTRTDVGLPGPFVSAVPQKLQVAGSAAVPVGATGVLLNVTVVSPSAAGFVSIRPGDATGVPSTSSLNFGAGDIVPNSVQVALPTSGVDAGRIEITYDAFGQAGPTTEILVDVVGYLVAGGAGSVDPAISARVDALEAANAALSARVSALESKLASVSTGTVGGRPTVTFSGVNVRIVDGTGNTECSVVGFEACNGRGNLILGYNEDTGSAESRTGSHSLVIGTENDWTSHSNLVAGFANTASGRYASIVGGAFSTASGTLSAVSGGGFHSASGDQSTVIGGSGTSCTGTFQVC